ncbi:MAG TPA: hypothetical protein VE821_02640, partial [Pyrinomonadaceae bacterium]|nr:hypothetical protein [Pyrinomonadaceae bacterium]
YQAALALITLAQQLQLEANIEHAQEIVYEAIRSNGAVPAGLRELAEQLRLAPVLLHPTNTDEAPAEKTADGKGETAAQAEVLVQPETVAVSLEPKLEGAV